MTDLTQPIEKDSFLNLLDELRDELEMISTTNALTTNVEGDDDIENAVMKSLEIVDTIAADLVAKQEHKNSGYTNALENLPANTLNNDAFYIGINTSGFNCIFNHIEHHEKDGRKITECYYIIGNHHDLVMTELKWWRILERPTATDFFEEGEQAFNNGIPENQNPYPERTLGNHNWNLGWNNSIDLPF